MKERDWALEAGLKKKPKAKPLDNWAKYIPTMSEVTAGTVCMLFGTISLTNGAIFLQATATSEPVLINLEGWPVPLSLLAIWIGIDMAFFKERATLWLLSKFVYPALRVIGENTIGEERTKALGERFGRKSESST